MNAKVQSWRRKGWAVATVLMAVVAWRAFAEFEIIRSGTGSAGGGAGGDFELAGTILGPSETWATGGAFELSGGFWFSIEPGDCGQDGGVGLVDYSEIAGCISGPAAPLIGQQCACADLDADDDVDLHDFAELQRALTQ